MTEDQIKHICILIDSFTDKAFDKYAEGARHHGGNLWEHDLLWLIEQGIEESIDQFVYLMTARQKIIEGINNERGMAGTLPSND